MGKGDEPAFPQRLMNDPDYAVGLTKREYIAIEAMKGFCSNPGWDGVKYGVLAAAAFAQADAMIAEGEKE